MQTALNNLINSHLGLSSQEAENHTEILINAFDLEHKVVFWNKRAEIYFHINKLTAIGKRLEELVPYVKNNEKTQLLDRALNGTPIYVAKSWYYKLYAPYEQWVIPVIKEGKIIAALNIVKTL